MARPRKKEPDLGQMADDVSEILHALVRDGYVDEVAKIRRFLEAQGEHFVKQRKMNRDINTAMSKRLVAAERALKQAKLPVPQP